MDKILVVDLGGQYAHLIANRLRRLGFLSDISPPESIEEDMKAAGVKGMIFSGGPQSVYESGSPTVSMHIINSGMPILGICYGHQLIAHMLDGVVKPGAVKEYGIARISSEQNILFDSLDKQQTVWMSHGDSVSRMPEGFKVVAESKDCSIAGMADDERKLYGIQFHPEVAHTINGNKILENFASKICRCKKEWNTNSYMHDISEYIMKIAKGKKVFLLVSGGVDSVVLFTLLNKVLGKENVFGLHVDTGLMRLDESSEVKAALLGLGFDNLETVDASEQLFHALKGKVNPEDKRRIIGESFIDVIEQYSDKLLESDDWLVAQGTIYPDTIESKGTKNSNLIKTHHNRVPKMQLLIDKGKVIEPLSHLYKDEVRFLGNMLGLPSNIINRHPFPGPGLGVRILCNDSNADDLLGDISLIEEQACSVKNDVIILPIKSVGVQGDSRTYKHPAVIYHKDFHDWDSWDVLEKESTELTNKVPGINRVLLQVTRKDGEKNGEIKLLKRTITMDRVELLKKADKIAENIMIKHHLYDKIWQMPVVLAPLSVDGGESIILRPVNSQEAMTANFSRLPKSVIEEIGKELMKEPGIDMVFYDITNKPPGTIEWE